MPKNKKTVNIDIRTNGIKKEFFKNPLSEYICMICQEGKCSIPMKSILEYISIIDNQKNKKIDIKPQNNLKQCKCSLKHILEFFCQDCKSAFCRGCSKNNHENHDLMLLSELYTRNKETKYEKALSHMRKIQETFNDFQRNLLVSSKFSIEIHDKEFNEICDGIIHLMKKLKEKNIQKSTQEYQLLQTQLSLMQNSFVLFNDEIEKNKYNSISVHPNKLFHMNTFFSETFSEKNFKINDFSLKISDENAQMKEIKSILERFTKEQEENRFLDFFGIGGLFFVNMSDKNIRRYDNFLTDPIDLFKRKQAVLLEKGSFNFGFYKSNVTTSFIVNDETFFVWPGTKDFQSNTYPIHIYNLSLKKKEAILQGNPTLIIVLSTYPKDANYDAKKWLYTGDYAGILRVYDISKDKEFNEIYRIETKDGEAILSAVIFDDKYNELDSNEKGVYVMISSNDSKFSLRIYKFDTIGGGAHLYREIINPMNKICYTINFYYDETISKSSFFFGFSESFIRSYDLKSNSWLKSQYETKGGVTSINFILRNVNTDNLLEHHEKIERYLLYTQDNNLIVLIDIDTGNIMRKLALSNIKSVKDVCVWNSNSESNYLIIATYDQNSIKILSFESLQVLCTKETGNSIPVNLLKVLIKEHKNNALKEAFITCEKDGIFLM